MCSACGIRSPFNERALSIRLIIKASLEERVSYWRLSTSCFVERFSVGYDPWKEGGKPMVNKTPLIAVVPRRLWPAFGFVAIGSSAVVLAALVPRGSGSAPRKRMSVPGQEPFVAGRPTATSPSSAATDVIDLGTIVAGGNIETRLHLVNPSDFSIDIASFRTSCPCLSVEIVERQIAPQQAGEAVARLDLSDDPGFTGGLCPEVEFFDAQGNKLFDRSVSVTVVGGSANFSRLQTRQARDPAAQEMLPFAWH